MADKIIPTSEIGRSGLKQYGGNIYEEFLRQLNSDTLKNAVYKEMYYNDSTISAIMFAIKMLMRQVEWTVEGENEEYKEFLESCIDDMSHTWQDMISSILSCLSYGWSYFETVYKYRQGQNKDASKRSKFNDGKLGWRKIALRSQDTLSKWEFDDEGGLAGMVQCSMPDYIDTLIPIEKSLLFRTSIDKDSPEGESLLRKLYIDYYYKKKIQSYEAIGIERDLAGLPLLWVPQQWTDSNADASQKQAFSDAKKLVTNVRRDEQEGLVLPSIFDENGNQLLKFELVTTGGKRNFDTSAIIQRFDQRMTMTVLADFILLGHEKVGSFALSSNKTDLFGAAIGSWLDMIAAVFNRYAVPRLFELNGFNLEELPELKHGDIETPNLGELGEYINKLSGAGIDLSGDLELENYLRNAASLPERTEEDFEIMQEQAQNNPQNLPMNNEQQEFIEAVKELRVAVKKAIDE